MIKRGVVAVDGGLAHAFQADALQRETAEFFRWALGFIDEDGAQAALDELDMGGFGDGFGIEVAFHRRNQRFEDLIGHARARNGFEIDGEERCAVELVRALRIDIELKQRAVGQDAELHVGHGVEVSRQPGVAFGKIGARALHLDGDDGHAFAQHGEVRLTVGRCCVFGIDLVGVGVVVAEKAQERQHEVELGAFLVAAGGHDADGALCDCQQSCPKLIRCRHEL